MESSAPNYEPVSKWYVLYVRSRTEKKVAERLLRQGIECYLPLVKVMRQWSDRRKKVEVPLFNGYLFVHIHPDQFTLVRMVEGVVNFVRSAGRHATIPEDQIQTIRHFIETGLPGQTEQDAYSPGEKVRVNFGALKGCVGELVDIRNEKQFIVRIEAINQVLLVSLPMAYLEKFT